MITKEIIKSGIYGLAIGDILGVPVEFQSREELIKNPVSDMREYGVWHQPLGTWSDDTGLTLATMGGLIKSKGNIDYDVIMKEFVRWIVQGEYTQKPGIEPFDYGETTMNGILNYVEGVPVLDCGLKGEFNISNGSLMRILPFAFTDFDYEVIENMSGLTHSHDICKMGCVLYTEIARQIIKGGEDTFCDYVGNASDLIQKYYRNNEFLSVFQRIFDSDYSDGVTGRTYLVDTLESAIYSIKYSEDFSSSVLTAVNIGNDTDTVGAVCGGLAGLYYGLDDIPERWISNIYGIDLIDGLVDNFYNIL